MVFTDSVPIVARSVPLEYSPDECDREQSGWEYQGKWREAFADLRYLQTSVQAHPDPRSPHHLQHLPRLSAARFACWTEEKQALNQVSLLSRARGRIEPMRKVLKSDLRPLEIKPQEKSVWICMCGLSKNQPYCDGSPKAIGEEETGKVYEYDAEGHRVEV